MFLNKLNKYYLFYFLYLTLKHLNEFINIFSVRNIFLFHSDFYRVTTLKLNASAGRVNLGTKKFHPS